MKLYFLPKGIKNALSKLKTDELQEIRLRLNFPIKIKYKFEDLFLTSGGCSKFFSEGIVAKRETIDEIISNLTENSLYAHNERLKNGYLISGFGERIGVSGECVFADKIVTIKNITSVLIRIPKNVPGCSVKIREKMNTPENVLIISPPGFGKTTILKDLIQSYSYKNISVIDERGELFSENTSADYIRFSDKLSGLKIALRTLSPDIVAVDELFGEEDYKTCEKAIRGGVKIFATIHAGSEKEIPDILKKIFDLFVVLKNEKKAGEIDYIYDRRNL